jgi:hypothetical protein
MLQLLLIICSVTLSCTAKETDEMKTMLDDMAVYYDVNEGKFN